MVHLNLIPSWFLGYNIFFEFLFAIITLVVGIYAFKLYSISEQKQSKLFGIAFLFISTHYFIQSFLNASILFKLGENICTIMKIQGIELLNIYGIYSHMFFFMLGLITLTYMTLKIQDKKIYSLLLIIPFLSILFSTNKIYLFYLFSSIYLIYISAYYFKNYLENKKIKTLLVLVAFLFLLFGNIHFIFSINHGAYYIIGHFLEFVAYSLILINLLLILKNGKKKR